MTNKRRRKLLTFLGLSAIGITGGAFTHWKQSRESDIVIAILHNRLGSLDIDEADLTLFSLEYVKFRRQYKSKMKVLSMFSSLFSVITPYSYFPMGHPFRRLEDNIVSNFLLSTDFFQHGANQTRKLNYLGFYDPYKRPCAGFFSTGLNA